MSNFLLDYWQTLKGSLGNAYYYARITQKPLAWSMRFFVISLILMGLAQGFVFVTQTLPKWQEEVVQMRQELVNEYPSDLELSWDGRQIASSAEEPQPIFYPADFDYRSYNLPPRLGVIDLSQDPQPSPDDFLVVITQDHLWLNDFRGDFQTTSLSLWLGDEAWTMTANNLPAVLDQLEETLIEPWWQSLTWLGPIAIIAWLILGKSAMAVIEGILLYLVLYVYDRRLPYLKTLQLSLHLLIPAELVNQVGRLVYPQATFSFTSLAFWALAIYVLIANRGRFLLPKK